MDKKIVLATQGIRSLLKVVCPLLLLFWVGFALAQQPEKYLASAHFDDGYRGTDRFRIVFYNVENLFDYFNDSTTLDDEFLPNRGRFWTKARYQDKQQKIARTLIATGGWEPPALIGLCEIENRYVLNSLTDFTVLKTASYQEIHQDSPDRRGIDVAALYRPEKFRLLDYFYYTLHFPFAPESRTRDILHVVGQLPNRDTLHYFVNHWPSKFGGEFETQPKRIYAAQFLRKKVDSVMKVQSKAAVVITGDFNDEPDSESMTTGLGLQAKGNNLDASDLYNLMYDIRFKTGTHSFQNKWSILDQFIVSANLMEGNGKTAVYRKTAQVFDMPFLLTESATGTLRPRRTYQGPKYLGGYSDHLPILLDLVIDNY